VANPTNTTDSSALEFALSSLSAASDEQYESIPDDEIALLASRVTQVPEGEEEITKGLLRVRRHHPLHCRLPQVEVVQLLQQIQLQQPEQLQRQGRGQE
jgi:hypothetical protein